MSEFEGKAENICSLRVFRILTDAVDKVGGATGLVAPAAARAGIASTSMLTAYSEEGERAPATARHLGHEALAAADSAHGCASS